MFLGINRIHLLNLVYQKFFLKSTPISSINLISAKFSVIIILEKIIVAAIEGV